MAQETKSEEFSAFREHSRAAARAWGDSWKGLIPDAFWEKRRESRREALLAVRSLIDAALERVEGGGQPAPKSKKKVKVEAE
jgi:hypothetical protein